MKKQVSYMGPALAAVKHPFAEVVRKASLTMDDAVNPAPPNQRDRQDHAQQRALKYCLKILDLQCKGQNISLSEMPEL